MQGIWIVKDEGVRRPSSKKEVKEIALRDPSHVIIEATSLFGDEYDGRLSDAPRGSTIAFVGPDPYTKRRFYGNISVNGTGEVRVR